MRPVSLVYAAIGIGAVVAEQGRNGGRAVVRATAPVARSVVEPLPLRNPRTAALLQRLSERGREARNAVESAADEAASAVVPWVLDAVLDRVDLTAVVVERLDLNAVADTLDVDRVIDRADLIGVATFIIDGVDLPLIIRQSTQGITSEAVRGVRMQGFEADQAVTRVVDRLLLRHRDRQERTAPEVPQPRLNGKPAQAP